MISWSRSSCFDSSSFTNALRYMLFSNAAWSATVWSFVRIGSSRLSATCQNNSSSSKCPPPLDCLFWLWKFIYWMSTSLRQVLFQFLCTRLFTSYSLDTNWKGLNKQFVYFQPEQLRMMQSLILNTIFSTYK